MASKLLHRSTRQFAVPEPKNHLTQSRQRCKDANKMDITLKLRSSASQPLCVEKTDGRQRRQTYKAQGVMSEAIGTLGMMKIEIRP